MSGGIDVGKIFSTAVGGFFGGPIGMLASQLLTQIASQVIDQVIDQLPLPSVLKDAMQAAFHAQIGDIPGTIQNLQEFTDGLAPFLSPADQGQLQRGIDDLMTATQQFFNEAMKAVQEGGGSEETSGAARSGNRAGSSEGAAGAEAGGGGGDFFIAMATALGKALQEQADRVKALAEDLADAVDAAEGTEDEARADAQNDIMLIQTQLSSEALRLNFMSSGIHTALTQIGQALTNLGSAQ